MLDLTKKTKEELEKENLEKELNLSSGIQHFWEGFLDKFGNTKLFDITHLDAANYIRDTENRNPALSRINLTPQFQKKIQNHIISKVKTSLKEIPDAVSKAIDSLENRYINIEVPNDIPENYISDMFKKFNILLEKDYNNKYFETLVKNILLSIEKLQKIISVKEFYKNPEKLKLARASMLDVMNEIKRLEDRYQLIISSAVSEIKVLEENKINPDLEKIASIESKIKELKEDKGNTQKAYNYISTLYSSAEKIASPNVKVNQQLQANITKLKELFNKLKDKKYNELSKTDKELVEQIIYYIIHNHPLMGSKLEPLIGENGEIVKYEALLTGEMLYQDVLLKQLVSDNGKFLSILNDSAYLKTLNIDITIQHIFQTIYLNDINVSENLKESEKNFKGNIPKRIKTSINLSEEELKNPYLKEELKDPYFIEKIKDPYFIEVLKKLQFELKAKGNYELKDIISFELLEHYFKILDNPEAEENLSDKDKIIVKNLSWITSQKIEIGLDDFGEGHSNQKRLENMIKMNIKPAYVKIDANIVSALFFEKIVLKEDWTKYPVPVPVQEKIKRETIQKHLLNLIKASGIQEGDASKLAQKVLFEKEHQDFWIGEITEEKLNLLYERLLDNKVDIRKIVAQKEADYNNLLKITEKEEIKLVYEHVDCNIIQQELKSKGLMQGYLFNRKNLHPSVDLKEEINMSRINQYIYKNYKSIDRRSEEEYVSQEISAKAKRRRHKDYMAS